MPGDVVAAEVPCRLVDEVGEGPVGPLVGSEPVDRVLCGGSGVGDRHRRARLRRSHADPKDHEGGDGDETGAATRERIRATLLPGRRTAGAGHLDLYARRRMAEGLQLDGVTPRVERPWRRWVIDGRRRCRDRGSALDPDQPDGFPLSTYPMFAAARDRDVTVATAVGVDGAGAVHRLDPVTIGGTGEVMQAAETVGLAVRAGEPELSRLCAEIVGRLAGDGHLVAVEIRSESHDAVAWFDGDRDPAASVTHARCEVTP